MSGGSYESIYADVPAYGPDAATGVLPVEKRGHRAADRFAHRSSVETVEVLVPVESAGSSVYTE